MNSTNNDKICILCEQSGKNTMDRKIMVDLWKGTLALKPMCDRCWSPTYLVWMKAGLIIFMVCILGILFKGAIDKHLNLLLIIGLSFFACLMSYYVYTFGPIYRLYAKGRIATLKGRAILLASSLTAIALSIVVTMFSPGVDQASGHEVVLFRLGREVSRRSANDLDMLTGVHWIIIVFVVGLSIFSLYCLISAISIIPSRLLDKVSRKFSTNKL